MFEKKSSSENQEWRKRAKKREVIQFVGFGHQLVGIGRSHGVWAMNYEVWADSVVL